MHLFAYGTLQAPEVTEAVLGRVPESQPAALPDHRVGTMIDALYPGIRPDPDNTAHGRVLQDITPLELSLLDTFEGTEYERSGFTVIVNGKPQVAEVFLLRGEAARRMTDQDWSLEAFRSNDLDVFLESEREGRADVSEPQSVVTKEPPAPVWVFLVPIVLVLVSASVDLWLGFNPWTLTEAGKAVDARRLTSGIIKAIMALVGIVVLIKSRQGK